MRTMNFAGQPPGRRTASLLAVALALLVGGCGFFDDVFDDGAGDADTGTTDNDSADSDDTSQPPLEGFRVFPKFMLQDVPAIVTIERDAVDEPCLGDGALEGGYVCDATGMPSGPVTIRVEKDGFETTSRHPQLLPEQITALDVHLAVAGGPTGTWSACVAVGEFETCGDVCANEMLGCVVTDCATEQEEWPVATMQTFSAAECVEALESYALTCDDQLPIAAAASLRCCCQG